MKTINAILCLVIAGICVYLFSCTTTQIGTNPVIEPSKYPIKGWYYDDIVKAHLTPTMLTYGSFNKWAVFIKSVAVAESSLNRTDWMNESGIGGIDSITKSMVRSQGLMQLSYGDQLNYPKALTCKKMDYAKDKGKAFNDPTLTINDPEINIGCAMEIMNVLLSDYPENLTHALGRYWSTVRDGKAVF